MTRDDLPNFDVRDAKGKKGEVIDWLGEGPSVVNWTRTGWNRNSVKAGDAVECRKRTFGYMGYRGGAVTSKAKQMAKKTALARLQSTR